MTAVGVAVVASACFSDSFPSPEDTAADSTSGTDTGASTGAADTDAPTTGATESSPDSTGDPDPTTGDATGDDCVAWEQSLELVVPDGVRETLAHFPIPWRIPPLQEALHAAVGEGADGLRLFDAEDVLVPFEIESWAPGASAVVWIAVPQFGPEGLASLTVRYGDPSLAALPNDPTDVWEDTYVGVWHLAGLRGRQVLDSTFRAQHGESQGETAFVAGQVGSAFATATDAESIAIAGRALELAGPFTVEAWLSATATSIAGPMMHRMPVRKGGDYRLLAVHFTTGTPGLAVQVLPANQSGTAALVPLAKNQWTHVVGTFAADGISVYVDGELRNNNPMAGNAATSSDVLSIGGSGYRGAIDEVRVSSARRSDAWIFAQHAVMTTEAVVPGPRTPLPCD